MCRRCSRRMRWFGLRSMVILGGLPMYEIKIYRSGSYINRTMKCNTPSTFLATIRSIVFF